MEEKRRKEIEARLFQLISEEEKSKQAKQPVNLSAKTDVGAAKIIRRRKGHTDLRIYEDVLRNGALLSTKDRHR